MDCPDFGVCNPSVIQPNVRRQATLNRDTDSVVALTPNINWSLSFVLGRYSVGQRLPANDWGEKRMELLENSKEY